MANKTAEAIIARLPKAEMISTGDIAAACGYRTTSCVRAAIQAGQLDAIKMSGTCGKYQISRESAVRWIRTISEKED